MNRAAQQLGRKGKGKPKTMTDAALQQRREAIKSRWKTKKRRRHIKQLDNVRKPL
jgi:hypothetical protein